MCLKFKKSTETTEFELRTSKFLEIFSKKFPLQIFILEILNQKNN